MHSCSFPSQTKLTISCQFCRCVLSYLEGNHYWMDHFDFVHFSWNAVVDCLALPALWSPESGPVVSIFFESQEKNHCLLGYPRQSVSDFGHWTMNQSAAKPFPVVLIIHWWWLVKSQISERLSMVQFRYKSLWLLIIFAYMEPATCKLDLVLDPTFGDHCIYFWRIKLTW